jgi:hypothetical protein
MSRSHVMQRAQPVPERIAREMFRRLFRLLKDNDAIGFIVAEVSASIGIAVVTWLATEDKKEALLMAGAGIGLLWILVGRLQLFFLKDDMLDRFKESRQSLETLAGLRINAFKDEWLSIRLKVIVDGTGEALELNDKNFTDFVRMRLDTFALEMEGVSHGVIRAPAAVSTKWAMERMMTAKSIFATTYSKVVMTFWMSPGGREYLQANIDAHRKHRVEITRAFILDGDVYAATVVKLIKDHVTNGLNVWVIRHKEVDAGQIEDFIAFNNFTTISFWEAAHASDELSYVRWSSNASYTAKATGMKEYLAFRADKLTSVRDFDAWLQRRPAP